MRVQGKAPAHCGRQDAQLLLQLGFKCGKRGVEGGEGGAAKESSRAWLTWQVGWADTHLKLKDWCSLGRWRSLGLGVALAPGSDKLPGEY